MKQLIINVIKQAANKHKINVNFTEANYDVDFRKLGFDSINILEILLEIEKQTGLRLDDTQLLNIKTVNQLVAAFEAKKK